MEGLAKVLICHPELVEGCSNCLLFQNYFFTTVEDGFDSMTSDRPYRPAPGTEYAISELKKCSGIQFDPQVVETFLRILNKSASLNPSV